MTYIRNPREPLMWESDGVWNGKYMAKDGTLCDSSEEAWARDKQIDTPPPAREKEPKLRAALEAAAVKQHGYRLTIPRVPLSPNRLLGKHWSAKAKEKLTWMEEIRAAGGKEQAKGKMCVTITLYNARCYDADNAWGACKPILDAMKGLGLIIDDRASYCDLTVRQEKSTRKDKRTVIEVEPA